MDKEIEVSVYESMRLKDSLSVLQGFLTRDEIYRFLQELQNRLGKQGEPIGALRLPGGCVSPCRGSLFWFAGLTDVGSGLERLIQKLPQSL